MAKVQKAPFRSTFYNLIPRCRICFQPIISACDRLKPAERVEWLGQMWTEAHPQIIMMFPTAEDQPKLCYYHQKQAEIISGRRAVGKDSNGSIVREVDL